MIDENSNCCENIIELKGICQYFPTKQKDLYVKAVDNIDLNIRKNEILGLVGESGSGKSTTAYMVVGMNPPTEGQILFKGTDISMPAKKRPLDIKKEIQIVFQDPGTTLNPQKVIGKILSLPLKVHKIVPKKKIGETVEELLTTVDLPVETASKYCRVLGGGERQMVAIARALATNPSLMVLDEPTSALDVSIQAKIINTLLKIKNERNMSYLFITHDMSLMRNIADRIAIMYLGKIVELAPTIDFYTKPKHPYTKMLLSSIPVVLKAEENLKPKQIHSQGEIPSPVNLPKGCRFQTRCPFAEDVCRVEEPQLREVLHDHQVACHFSDKQ